MPADVVSLAQLRLARAAEDESLPVALTALRGAVEMVVGTEDDCVELHMSPQQAIALGRDIVRMGEEARRGA